MDQLSTLIYSIPALLIALTLHEFAHGWVSDKLGDPTPRRNGRLSLNPLRHLDPLGTLSLFLFHFGWAKPVMVNPNYYQNKKQGMVNVAMAGPMMNFLLAFISIFAYYGIIKMLRIGLIPMHSGIITSIFDYLLEFLPFLLSYNLGLGIFNLIPIPPLDGSKFLNALLPEQLYFSIMRYERYFAPILILLLYTGILNIPLDFVNDALFNLMKNISLTILRL